MIRPMLRANRARKHRTHIFVFFIILVANVGGALTPLGDPPLFIGFMEGVPFFWPTRHLLLPTLLAACLLLAAFWAVDSFFHGREEHREADVIHEIEKLHVRGRRNIALLVAVLLTVLLSGTWDPGIVVPLPGAPLPLEKLVATLLLLVITIVSLRRTSRRWRLANEFSWHAMREVAVLFAAIFVTILPALHLLRQGPDGPAASIFSLVQGDAAYFWATGIFSAVLDNAPTYLIFFTMAGGDAARLVAENAGTLAAISMGAVYFGALTYIGNAPNLMVRAVVEGEGVRMPNFFVYAFWAVLLLFPVFALVTLLFL
jgi:Na+/H+ antiporter NhaD/arsenite permease-like protein